MIAFIDLAAQRALIKDRLDAAIARVVEEGAYILGPQVAELEAALKSFGQAEHALSCANGTDAIALPLMAWKIRPGDAVFVPSFTFAATAEVVAWLGATPVFVDIDPDTYCMDPASLEAAVEAVTREGALTPRAVIAVDLFGQPADYPALSAITRRHGMKLVADSAQGFGCTLNGRHPVHWADIATISFYPAKPLGCYGDGGAVVTNDAGLAGLIASLRNHGQGEVRYAYDRIGMNSRLDTIQAAVLLAKLEIFASEIEARNAAAKTYEDALADLVKTPKVIEGGVSVWAQYTIETGDRDALRARLGEAGVPTAVYYPSPMHVQAPYAHYPKAPGGLPVTERAMARVVSLPMDAYVGGARQDAVIKAVRALA